MKNLHKPNLFREACYVNGEWIKAHSKKTIPVFNPYDSKQIGEVPKCTREETKLAIEAAYKAWLKFREYPAKERSDLLWKLAQLIDDNKEDLAKIMTYEQGKPIKEARTEIEYANSFITWFAEEGRRLYGDIIPSNKTNQHLLVMKQAIGVVGIITPWNFPTAMIARKIAPALAVGCTVVIKPAEETPFSAIALMVLAEEAGIPKGVINLITGIPEDIGSEMTTHPYVRKISFTGSTAVGSRLMAQSASTIKKLSLELGGNAPFLVFDDADLDAAVDGLIIAKFRNTGQTCVCANRVFVQNTIYEPFTEKLVEKVKQLKVGNGFDETVQQGPLINQGGLDKVKAHVEDAVKHGAHIRLGGKPHSLGGLFFEPTIITNATTAMRLAKEETFGPVAPLFKFNTEEEGISLANETEFGLASYFYSKDMARIWRVAEKLESGMVGINVGLVSTEVAPFGGMKLSGIGREGSKYGMDDYVEMKYVCMNT